MKIWLLLQTEKTGWDTFDSAVVTAETEEEAQKIHPNWPDKTAEEWKELEEDSGYWASCPENVRVLLIGEAVEGAKRGVILASFNRG